MLNPEDLCKPINYRDQHGVMPAMFAARQRVDVFSAPELYVVMLISRFQEPGFLKLKLCPREEKKGGVYASHPYEHRYSSSGCSVVW